MPSANLSDHSPLSKGARGLAHHKLGPGVAALHSSAFQEMDEYAPYRIVFLLLFIVSSVALWASYKIICESDGASEEGTAGGAAYRPLSQPTDGDAWTADFGEEDDESLCSHDTEDFLGK
ncbi:hypothetical protein niasHT_001252 [Heterodera trifolii]|uniref:Uncharacterized protein n=1 Tax=Heterodera trifolii TaxID=157864 RepID=A0ABD2M692_9BILA